jgi:YHS domain-containing protein
MFWIYACPTCGEDVDKGKSVTRKFYGDTFYFDTEACAQVFDGTGSIVGVHENLSRR